MYLPVLTQDAVQTLMGTHRTRKPLQDTADDLVDCQLGLVTDVTARPVDHVPSMHMPLIAGLLRLRVAPDLVLTMNSSAGSNEGQGHLTPEAALFPHLFPHGVKFWTPSYGSFCDYLQYRLSMHFSPFTLCKPYLLMMYQIRQLQRIVSCTKEICYEKEVRYYQRNNPEADYETAIKHVAVHKVPTDIPGTPGWHKSKLEDLKAVCGTKGLPHAFLTLTSDEASPTRWSEVDVLEAILRTYNKDFKWHDAPCEHAQVFLDKLNWFLDNYILDTANSKHIYGRVTYFVVRLECQQRGCLHAHIMLWLAPEDIDEFTSEICAQLPFIDSQSSLYDKTLHTLVTTKQQHVCRPEGCMAEGHCRYGFPFQLHPETPSLNASSHRWEYTRCNDSDRMTVPYPGPLHQHHQRSQAHRAGDC